LSSVNIGHNWYSCDFLILIIIIKSMRAAVRACDIKTWWSN